MKIFVIIVTFNGEQWLKKNLNSLRKSSVPLSVIIIDNHSNDDTTKLIKDNYPEVLLIENEQNLGFGKANNIGLKHAIEKNGDYIFLLNQDVWIEADTVKKLIELHRSDPQFGIVSPVHLDGKGTELDKYFSTYIPYKTLAEIKKAKTGFVETNFVNAAAWLLSRDCILKVGGFDPLFNHYGEDRDFCNRIMYHGFTIGVSINSSICHDRKYITTNKYQKKQNLIFASGLAHVKNINKPLFNNYLSWIKRQSKKFVKYLIFIDIISFYSEINVLYKLLLIIRKIDRSRKLCMSVNPPYLF
jgi:GT2 family glycosyltransferase